MTFVRRRYYFWLLRAYFTRWKRTILISSILGVALFFAALLITQYVLLPSFEGKVERIGMSGIYKPDTLPPKILEEVSFGLTAVGNDGKVYPKAAISWEIKNKAKEYIFHLRKGIYFHNGTELTTKSLPLSYNGVKRTNLDKYTVEFQLKDPYSPFLATVSRPIFIHGYSGLGTYILKTIKLNAGYVESLTLQDKNNPHNIKQITFYPTESSLKIAFSLGEIDQAVAISDTSFEKVNFDKWKNVSIRKNTDYSTLVTIFYNTADSELSNKKLRQALNYALPASFVQGERAYSPIPKYSIYYNAIQEYTIYDPDIAKTLIAPIPKEGITITLSTTKDYEPVAKTIQTYWSKIGITTKIKLVEGIPDNFQSLLFAFSVPPDPDQYTLWHSDQINNISRYKNLRIDKLLEDGREIPDINQRIQIYHDFQKYLLDDVPASFLYFPTSFTLVRSK